MHTKYSHQTYVQHCRRLMRERPFSWRSTTRGNIYTKDLNKYNVCVCIGRVMKQIVEKDDERKKGKRMKE